jgi:P27 family predicted phage terminase small subunit
VARGKGGRKGTPKEFKVIKGTFRKDRDNPDAPKPQEGSPEAPDKFTARQAELFGRLTARLQALGIASPSYTEMLMLAARRWAEIEECDRLIEQYGRVYETTNQGGDRALKQNPAVAMKNEAERHLQSLLAEFGLSATAIGKAKAVKNGAPSSEWREFA